MLLLYYMILFVPGPSMAFSTSHDFVTITIVTLYNLYNCHISHHIITLSKFKIKKNSKVK